MSQNFIPQGGYFDWQQGLIGRSILGNSPKFYSERYSQYSPFVRQPILVDISPGELMKVATQVPHLNVVISKLASMFTQMQIKHVNKDGVEIENSDVLKLLKKPNPLQSQEGFLYDYALNHFIYNCEFIYKNYTTSSRVISPLPKTLWCMPSGLMRVNMTGKMYDQVDLSGIIENFTMIYRSEPFPTESIILISEAFSTNGIVSKSKIETLQIPLSNIVAALKLFNIIASEGKTIGIVSQDNTGSNENTPPAMGERERLEKDYNTRYDVDGRQGHISFTSASLKWSPMEYDVGKLMLAEGQEDNFCLICGALGADRMLFPQSSMQSKGFTTGKEKNEGLKITFQNTIQAIADKLMNVFEDHFFTDKQKSAGEQLEACYDHLPCMKEDAVAAETARKIKTERHSQLKKDGIISPEAYAEFEEIKLTGTGESEESKNTFGNDKEKEG